jgi:hypothetical protein
MISEHIATTIRCDAEGCERYIATDCDVEAAMSDAIAKAAGWRVSNSHGPAHYCPAHKER